MMQESSPSRKRSGRSSGKAAAKSRRQKAAAAKETTADVPETRGSILARLELMDNRLNEALSLSNEAPAVTADPQIVETNTQVLEAVVNQGKAISQIALVLEALQGSLSEVTPMLQNQATSEEPAAAFAPCTETEGKDSSEMAAASDETQTQSWEEIKQAMLGDSGEPQDEDSDEADPEAPDEDVLFEIVSQAHVDELDEDGLRTLIIDQERIISRLVRRVQQKSRKELQLSPEQLHDCAKNLPEELAVRVETTLKTLDEQARLGELELSLERARISRQLSHLDETRQIIESNARGLGLEIGPEGKIEGAPGMAKRNGSKGRRWLGALGFGD